MGLSPSSHFSTNSTGPNISSRAIRVLHRHVGKLQKRLLPFAGRPLIGPRILGDRRGIDCGLDICGLRSEYRREMVACHRVRGIERLVGLTIDEVTPNEHLRLRKMYVSTTHTYQGLSN